MWNRKCYVGFILVCLVLMVHHLVDDLVWIKMDDNVFLEYI